MTVWMGDAPRTYSKKLFFKFFEEYDIHKWIIARETGKGGYEHWQFRFQTSQDDIFEEFKDWFKKGHIEKASDTWNYERKDGNYLTDTDNAYILRRRFGRMSTVQSLVLQLARESGDRDVIVWHTNEGRCGKSFFTSALWERGLAHYIQPSNTAKGLIQDVASEFIENGYRPMVVIDIPRTWKWTDDLYFAIEKIKDGLIKDTRYHSRTIDIVGTAVIVMCNSYPKVGKLSADRWIIYSDEHPLT